MQKIIAVRHAESIANTEGIFQGQTYDTDLSVLGNKQARALAIALEEEGIGQIITSPLKRTKQTAQIISERLHVHTVEEISIIETDHGLWESENKQWIRNSYPELLDIWEKNPADAVFPEGETFVQTIERVKSFLLRTIFDDNTLIVTHDNIVRIIIAISNGLDFNRIWDIDTDPAGITEFEIHGYNGTTEFKTVKINDTRHLNGLRSDLSLHAL